MLHYNQFSVSDTDMKWVTMVTNCLYWEEEDRMRVTGLKGYVLLLFSSRESFYVTNPWNVALDAFFVKYK